jgi:hypothetical protein
MCSFGDFLSELIKRAAVSYLDHLAARLGARVRVVLLVSQFFLLYLLQLRNFVLGN